MLGHAAAIDEAGLATVTGAGVDFVKLYLSGSPWALLSCAGASAVLERVRA